MFAGVVAAVLPELGLGLPRNAALGGERVDALLVQTGILTASVALLLGVILVVAVLRRGRRSRPASPRLTLIVALGLFAIIDGNLLLHGELAEARAELAEPPIEVEVNAHQWAWDVRSAGLDGRFGTDDDPVELNELVVPVGREVEVELAAVDVVHGFSIPSLRVKADAVPGQITRLSFTVATAGEYEIACAQHCGLNHYKMRGILKAVSEAEYLAWLTAASREAVVGDDPADVGAHWAWAWATP